ncbi:hypothetical protein F2P79_001975 [Pimephales promelas]|nr:hypothetical protein F2P79_001975 [Pimephales promelas]
MAVVFGFTVQSDESVRRGRSAGVTFSGSKFQGLRLKRGNVDKKKDWETTWGVSPMCRRDIEEAVGFWLFLLFAGKANLTDPWGHRDEDSTLPLPALPPGCTAQPTSILDIPPPHTQLCNSFSARSRRTSHGPRADCSFRLAISDSTRSTAFQPQEERRMKSMGRSHLPFQNDFLGRVEDFEESNTCNECER